MKTIDEMIAVMTAYKNGAEIEMKISNFGDLWQLVLQPSWSWNDTDYRIKEQKKTITIEKVLFENGSIAEGTSEYIKSISKFSKNIKLLETYEVEL